VRGPGRYRNSYYGPEVQRMDVKVPRPVRCGCVVGTRPEVIKTAPVYGRLRQSDWAEAVLISTGQHDALLDLALTDFSLQPDFSVDYIESSDLASLLAHLTIKLDSLFAGANLDCILAQGDTSSTLAAALAAFYRRIPFVHVEAGLRTGDLTAPFPEEFHRRAIAVATTLHCAPTSAAANQLKQENIRDDQILVSGNTVIDALLEVAAQMPPAPSNFPTQARPILLTAHRRENFGYRLHDAFMGIRAFVDLCPDTGVFFPVHPNPNARAAARAIFSGHPRITLAEPLSYREMVGVLQRCWLVVTDSGGLQEEAPALGKPVLVLRDITERPEGVDAGVARLTGTSQQRVFRELMELYSSKASYKRMARRVFPYGDGHAATRIVASLRKLFSDGIDAEPLHCPSVMIVR
jgi:UDP-N-acetylglucosamine 2-epimerase (non-hydrolysing)